MMELPAVQIPIETIIDEVKVDFPPDKDEEKFIIEVVNRAKEAGYEQLIIADKLTRLGLTLRHFEIYGLVEKHFKKNNEPKVAPLISLAQDEPQDAKEDLKDKEQGFIEKVPKEVPEKPAPSVKPDEDKTEKQAFQRPELGNILDKIRIYPHEPIKEEDYCITVNGLKTCSLGGLSLIIGQKKSRKSHLAISFAIAALTGQEFLKLSVKLPAGKNKVLLLDTEQSKIETQRLLRKIKLASGLDYPEINDRLYHCNIRGINAEDSLNIVQELMGLIDGVGLVIVDGVRELVTDINNSEQATNALTPILKLCDKHNLHFMGVLHMNKGRGEYEARGHIGTEFANKAQYIFTVSHSRKYSTVSGEGRQPAFDPFDFGHDEHGIPMLTINQKDNRMDIPITSIGRQKKPRPVDFTPDENREKLQKVMERGAKYTYAELEKLVMKTYNVGETIARKESIPQLRELGLIVQNEQDYHLTEV